MYLSALRINGLIGFALLLVVFGCGKTNSPQCKYGEPKAIFNATQPSIQSHEFTAREHEAIEKVTFKDGAQLTLLQNGCDNVRQEFQMTLSGDYSNREPAFWIEEAVRWLKRLSNMGPDYQTFSLWAQGIDNQKDTIKLSESTQVQPGFYATVDRILSADSATLVLILSDVP